MANPWADAATTTASGLPATIPGALTYTPSYPIQPGQIGTSTILGAATGQAKTTNPWSPMTVGANGIAIAQPPQPHGVGGFFTNLFRGVKDIGVGVGSMAGMVLGDVIHSGSELIHGHPVTAAEGVLPEIGLFAGGPLGLAAGAALQGRLPGARDQYHVGQMVNALPGAIWKDLSTRYGPLFTGHFSEFGHQLYMQPLSFASDVLTAATLGGTAASTAAGLASKFGETGKVVESIAALSRESETLTTAARVASERGLTDEAASLSRQIAEKASEIASQQEQVPSWIRSTLPGIGTPYAGGSRWVATGRADQPFAEMGYVRNPIRRLWQQRIIEPLLSAPVTNLEQQLRSAGIIGGDAERAQQLIDQARLLNVSEIDKPLVARLKLRRAVDMLVGEAGSKHMAQRGALQSQLSEIFRGMPGDDFAMNVLRLQGLDAEPTALVDDAMRAVDASRLQEAMPQAQVEDALREGRLIPPELSPLVPDVARQAVEAGRPMPRDVLEGLGLVGTPGISQEGDSVVLRGYHGTFEPGNLDLQTTRLGQGTHVGSEQAARARLEFLRGEGATGEGRIIPTEVRLRKTVGSIDNPVSDYQLSEAGLPLDELRQRGYEGVIYRNAAEDPGSLSVLALDPRSLRQGWTDRLGRDASRAETSARLHEVIQREREIQQASHRGEAELARVQGAVRPLTHLNQHFEQVARDLYDRTMGEPWGGATYDPVTGHLATTGFAGGAVRNSQGVQLSIREAMDFPTFRAALQKMVAQRPDLLGRDEHYIGTFRDEGTGMVTFEPSRVVPTEGQARDIATALGSTGGFYDFVTGNGIFPHAHEPGTSEFVASLSPEQRAMIGGSYARDLEPGGGGRPAELLRGPSEGGPRGPASEADLRANISRGAPVAPADLARFPHLEAEYDRLNPSRVAFRSSVGQVGAKLGATKDQAALAFSNFDAMARAAVTYAPKDFPTLEDFYRRQSVAHAERYIATAHGEYLKVIRNSTQWNRLLKLAKAQGGNRMWYQEGSEAIKIAADVFHAGWTGLADGHDIKDTDLMFQLVAAMSPREAPVSNLKKALRVLQAYKTGGLDAALKTPGMKPNNREMVLDILSGSRRVGDLPEATQRRLIAGGHTVDDVIDTTIPGWEGVHVRPSTPGVTVLGNTRVGELGHARITPSAEGRLKVWNFYNNLRGQLDHTTIDTWIAKLFEHDLFGPVSLTPARYHEYEGYVRGLTNDLNAQVRTGIEQRLVESNIKFAQTLPGGAGTIAEDTLRAEQWFHDEVDRAVAREGWHPAEVQAALWYGVKQDFNSALQLDSRRLRMVDARLAKGDVDGALQQFARIRQPELKFTVGSGKDKIVQIPTLTARTPAAIRRYRAQVQSWAGELSKRGKAAGRAEDFAQAISALNADAGSAQRILREIYGDPAIDPALALRTAVKGDDGLPMRMYHGTSQTFEQFDLAKADPHALVGPGLYFSSDPRLASSYAGDVVTEEPFTIGHPYLAASKQDATTHAEHLLDQAIAGGFQHKVHHVEEVPRPQMERLMRQPGGPYTVDDLRTFLANRSQKYWQAYTSVPPKRPQVRPAYLDIRHPLDVEQRIAPADLVRIRDSARSMRDELLDATARRAGENPDDLMRVIRDNHGDVGAIWQAERKAYRSDPALRQIYSLDQMHDYLSSKVEKYGVSPQRTAQFLPIWQDMLRSNQPTLARGVIERAGFDGIHYEGGRIMPIMDAEGKPIRHDVFVAFRPEQVIPWHSGSEVLTKVLGGDVVGAFKPGGELSGQMTFFKSLDASSFVRVFGHEQGHGLLYTLMAAAPDDLRQLETYFMVRDSHWTRAAQERFADTVERYLATGVAPAEVRGPLQRFRAAVSNLWGRVRGHAEQNDVVPAPVRNVLDKWLGRDGTPPLEDGSLAAPGDLPATEAGAGAAAPRTPPPGQSAAGATVARPVQDAYRDAILTPRPDTVAGRRIPIQLPDTGGSPEPLLQPAAVEAAHAAHQLDHVLAGETDSLLQDIHRTFRPDVEVTARAKPTASVERAMGEGGTADPARGVRTIPDLVAGRITVGHVGNVAQVLERVRQLGEIVGIPDNFMAAPMETGFRGIRVYVRRPSGMLAELQLLTPGGMQVAPLADRIFDMIRDRPAAIEAMKTNPETAGQVGLAQVQYAKSVAHLRSLWEPVQAEIEGQLSGAGTTDAWMHNLRTWVEQTLTSPMYDNGTLQPWEAFDRSYLPLRLASGAEWDAKLKDFTGGADSLALHEARQRAGLATPIYFPHQDVSRLKFTDFLMSRRTVGAAKAAAPKFAKRNIGYLFERGRYNVNLPDVYFRRASQALRYQETMNLIREVTQRYGRRITDPAEISAGEALFAPDGLLRFFHQSITLEQAMYKGLGVPRGKIQDLDRELADALHTVLESSQNDIVAEFTGVTKNRGLYAIPKVVADRLDATYRPMLGINARLFWDEPTKLWRSFVLAGSPRWVVNNVLGNTLFIKLQGGRVRDVVRQFEPRFKKMLEDAIPPELRSKVDMGAGFFSDTQQRGTHLGIAGETRTGRFYQALGSTAPARAGHSFATFMQSVNGHIEDAYRRASYMKAAERQAFRNGIHRTARSFWSSEERLKRVAEVGTMPHLAEQAIKEMNYFLNDYTVMTPIERQVIRRFVFPFWSFYRHVGRMLLTLPFKYPGRFEALEAITKLSNDIQAENGPMPDWLRGSVPIGPGDQPGETRFLNTNGPNPFNGLFGTPLALLHPAIKTAIEQLTGRKVISGFATEFTAPDVIEPFGASHKYKVGPGGQLAPVDKVAPGLLESLLQNLPQYQLLEDVAAGGETYDTATLLSIMRQRLGLIPPGVPGPIKDIAGQPGPAYPLNPWTQLGKFGGISTTSYDLQAYQQKISEEERSAYIASLRRLGALPPAGGQSAVPSNPWSMVP